MNVRKPSTSDPGPLFNLPARALSQYFLTTIRWFFSIATGSSSSNDRTAALNVDQKAQFPRGTHFQAKIHPRVKEVTAEVDNWFLNHWPFESEKARKKFIATGFCRVTCLYYPLALDDRIHFACRLLTILSLIDDIMEDMSFEDGKAYNDRLMPLMRGDARPNRTIPVEWMMYDLWDSMRKCDPSLTNQILEPTFEFLRAQTDKQKLSIQELGAYLEYREKDFGKDLVCSVMRFVMAIHLTPAELESVAPLERNAAKHLSVLNDIYSWEKELIKSQRGHNEGSAICSSVNIVARECSFSYQAAKNVLWVMCREWEIVHQQLVQERLNAENGCDEKMKKYLKGLEYQISGNECWSETTPRYTLKDSDSALA